MTAPETLRPETTLILNVDDTESSRYMRTRTLRAAGYTVIEAQSGAEALRLIGEQRPSLLLLDVNLPDMNGIDIARRLKDDDTTAAIPIVQISATFVTEEDQEVGLEGGAEIYLTEPLQPHELVTAVRVLLRLRKTEHGLRQSEARWRSLVDSNIVGVAVVEDGAILDANDAFLALLGYDRSELANISWQSISMPDEIPRARRGLTDLLSRGTVEPVERQYLRKDGTPVWVLIAAARLGDRGTRFLCFVLDVTERKRAAADREDAYERERVARRQAEETTQLKDEFLANLSHELRTPMNAIIGWSHLLLTGTLDEENHQKAVEAIDRSARSQAQLIEDLLDVSRIVSGKLLLAIEPLDLRAIAEAAIETQRLTAEEKSVEIALEVPVDSVLVNGDGDRLQQVVLNLLTNAVKFTPPGGRIDVIVKRTPSEAVLQVADTGEGIAADFLPYVFDRFRQADGTARRKHTGLGLGLGIVRHVVDLHGGTVRAVSAGPGAGATFTVLLPLAKSAASAQRADHPPEPIPASGVGIRVLVVENDAETREVVGAILTRAGFVYRIVSSAHSALDVLDRWVPHVVVSDIGMPEVDGYEFMRALRARPREKGGAVPALALSAFARAEDRQRALETGFQGYVAKPVDPVDLVKAIHAATGESG